jgi:hypothetical protein
MRVRAELAEAELDRQSDTIDTKSIQLNDLQLEYDHQADRLCAAEDGQHELSTSVNEGRAYVKRLLELRASLSRQVAILKSSASVQAVNFASLFQSNHCHHVMVHHIVCASAFWSGHQVRSRVAASQEQPRRRHA